MSDQVIRPAGINVNITPFAFQHYAKDFYEAYIKHKGGPKFSPARLFLLARSIELAAKSLHLAHGRELDDIVHMDHNLEAACDPNVLVSFGITQTQVEEIELKKANDYYRCKGFEYFLFKLPGVPMERSGPQQALSGWPRLPDESTLEALLHRLVAPKL